jgi:hypothetical protein
MVVLKGEGDIDSFYYIHQTENKVKLEEIRPDSPTQAKTQENRPDSAA